MKLNYKSEKIFIEECLNYAHQIDKDSGNLFLSLYAFFSMWNIDKLTYYLNEMEIK